MAKIRVHELAKELNMSNTALLKKLKEFKIEVKSHMSSLDDREIGAIKNKLFGSDKKNDVKTKSGVIRRRRPSTNDDGQDSAHEPALSVNETVHADKKEDKKLSADSDSTDLNRDNLKPADSNTDEPVDSAKSESGKKDKEKGQDRKKKGQKGQKDQKDTGTSKKSPAKKKSGAEKKKKKAIKKTTPAKIIKPAVQEPPQEALVHETQKAPDIKAEEIKVDELKAAGLKSDALKPDALKSDKPLNESNQSAAKSDKVQETTAVEPEITSQQKTDDSEALPSKEEKSTETENQEKNQETLPDKESGTDKISTKKQEKVSSKKSGDSSDSQEGKSKRSKSRKKKKKKISTPAKIVKIADPSILENLKKTTAQDHAHNKNEKNDRQGRQSKDKTDRSVKKRTSGAKNDVKAKSVPETPLKAVIDDIASDGTVFTKGKKDKHKDKGALEDTQTRKPGRKKQRKKKSVVEGDALYKGGRSRKKGKKETASKNKFKKTQITVPKAIKRRVKIDEVIELAELAKRMGIKANEMITKLMGLGVMATVNQTIDFETAVLVASEFDFEIEKASFEEETLINQTEEEESDELLLERAPVVTIMGHVDHGKTSLLDVIRKSKITSGEAGGITQHIGAYNVETANGGRITFLDTPGHAAFTAMRSRGAQVTDIVILVVAADDGVMPQTIEAINHSKAAGVPVVVAVNKMDKPGADPTRIMRELSEHDLLAEDWGGNIIFVQVSAKAETGIEELLEMVLLQSEVLELKANPDKKAFGYVIESRLDIGRGAVATVLVMQGTLKDGDSIVCGLHSGRIRLMSDDAGNRVKEAGPSTPVEIVGLTGIPNAGDEFIAVASDKDAKQIATHRMQKQRAKELAKKSRANLEKMFEKLGGPEVKELRLIVKADVHGSIEALNDSLKDLAKKEVDIKIVHSATGTINESDISLAAVSDAIIVGFNVRPTPQIRAFAKEENVDMRFYDIIYDVINDIQSALDGLMPSTFHENIIGRAEVRDIFVVPHIGTIAGCHISEGKVIRGKKVRLLREGIIKCDTALSSLRRFKEDVKEVEQGFECGIGLEKYNDIKNGDIIECYEVEERKYKAD